MKKAIYPAWMDIPCAECGRILKVFCWNSKDLKQHLHFCEKYPCLENYYYKKLPLKSAKNTISRLTTMRHHRNQKVSEYHDELHEKNVKEIREEFKEKETDGKSSMAYQENRQEYIRQLKLHKGIRDDQTTQDTEL